MEPREKKNICEKIFYPGVHQLTIIHTDITEAESLIKRLAEKERELNPDGFAGNTACVYFKMPYTPPYEAFNDLRKLILRVYYATGLRSDFRGIVAIDVGEWLGHEQEEYFTILLKYLFDHGNSWCNSMILRCCTQAQLHHFITSCARFVIPHYVDVSIFSDLPKIEKLIQASFDSHECAISRDAKKLLANGLTHQKLNSFRSIELVDRVTEDIITHVGCAKTVSVSQIREYLKDSSSILTMLAGRPLQDKERVTDENEII